MGLDNAEVRKALGLDPPELAELRARLQFPKRVDGLMSWQEQAKQMHRQTGRTTDMLVRALSELSVGYGRVFVVAPTFGILECIRGKMNDYMDRLGIMRSRAVFMTMDYARQTLNPHSEERAGIYYDHTCFEEEFAHVEP